jgi:hypothetical protein
MHVGSLQNVGNGVGGPIPLLATRVHQDQKNHDELLVSRACGDGVETPPDLFRSPHHRKYY